ncbi:MAG: HD domain-containing protein [Candidatus Acidiferrales bacterium]
MLTYPLRVRDLVHGFVYLTQIEKAVIRHPLFQRLRHIRQNDVAFYVYPSMNTSRFEHSLGCVSVVARMASNVVRGHYWTEYSKALSLGPDEFIQICRLYALLHDVGHLPLSHLFEMAFDDYVKKTFPGEGLRSICTKWFGGEGFEKLHEACGSIVAVAILNDIKIADSIKSPLLALLTQKTLPTESVFRPMKLLVDSELDADRIDSTRRDGLLAGGEYGAYDIERLCRAVFVQPHHGTWRLAYSHKAVTSMEALLLDRCRTHINIHFHHRVVAVKVAAREAISSLLDANAIQASSFTLDALPLRDDPWIWGKIRALYESNPASTSVRAALRVILYRDRDAMELLWKNRSTYNNWNDQLLSQAGLRELPREKIDRKYEQFITERLGVEVRVFWLKFKPIESAEMPLTDENGDEACGELLDVSSLTGVLNEVWRGEPNYFVVLLGNKTADAVRNDWIKHTADWMDRVKG